MCKVCFDFNNNLIKEKTMLLTDKIGEDISEVHSVDSNLRYRQNITL